MQVTEHEGRFCSYMCIGGVHRFEGERTEGGVVNITFNNYGEKPHFGTLKSKDRDHHMALFPPHSDQP